jgi:hypothetical protein
LLRYKKMSVAYRKNTPYTKRYADASNIADKHPNHVPFVLHYAGGALEKNKYLVPEHMTYGALLSHIRCAVGASAHESLFLYVEKISLTDDALSTHLLPPLTDSVGLIRTQYKHRDGFTYLVAVKESTFG